MDLIGRHNYVSFINEMDLRNENDKEPKRHFTSIINSILWDVYMLNIDGIV